MDEVLFCASSLLHAIINFSQKKIASKLWHDALSHSMLFAATLSVDQQTEKFMDFQSKLVVSSSHPSVQSPMKRILLPWSSPVNETDFWGF